MTFKRNTQGNKQGISAVAEAIDPLVRKNFMCSTSLDKILFKLSADTGGKISQSELIRDAIAKAYT